MHVFRVCLHTLLPKSSQNDIQMCTFGTPGDHHLASLCVFPPTLFLNDPMVVWLHLPTSCARNLKKHTHTTEHTAHHTTDKRTPNTAQRTENRERGTQNIEQTYLQALMASCQTPIPFPSSSKLSGSTSCQLVELDRVLTFCSAASRCSQDTLCLPLKSRQGVNMKNLLLLGNRQPR